MARDPNAMNKAAAALAGELIARKFNGKQVDDPMSAFSQKNQKRFAKDAELAIEAYLANAPVAELEGIVRVRKAG